MASIEKRYGGYRVKFRDPLGRQKSRTFAAKADAQRFAREVEVDKNRGNWVDPSDGDIPLATWAETFFSLNRRLSPTTQETYRRDVTKYVLPVLGAHRIGRLPAEDIEMWLQDEIAAGIAPSTVHRHYRTLRRMLEVAVEKQRLVANPCDRVKPPKVPKSEMTFLTWEQSIELAEAHSERFRALIYLAVDSGMRWSELIGLQRKNVEIATGKVRVVDQLVRLLSREFVRKEPKTPSSVRSITISPVVADVLATHLERFALPDRDGLVFPNDAGNAIAESSFYNQHFKRSLEKSGLKCRFHDLRHTSVALAIAGGAHPKAIQALMGHASITVPLDRYGHLLPNLDEQIAAHFDEQMRAAVLRRETQTRS